MQRERHYLLPLFLLIPLSLASCSSMNQPGNSSSPQRVTAPPPDYEDRLPQTINTGEKTVLVDPNVHAWGAYDAEGNLIKAGLATAGGNYCSDINKACRTPAGSYRIQSLGSFECKSRKYPVGRGGAPMPYCMYFNGGVGLHGSYEVVEANVSHGCVRMRVPDAEWMRFNFADIGTKVIVRSY